MFGQTALPLFCRGPLILPLVVYSFDLYYSECVSDQLNLPYGRLSGGKGTRKCLFPTRTPRGGHLALTSSNAHKQSHNPPFYDQCTINVYYYDYMPTRGLKKTKVTRIPRLAKGSVSRLPGHQCLTNNAMVQSMFITCQP